MNYTEIEKYTTFSVDFNLVKKTRKKYQFSLRKGGIFLGFLSGIA